jgi:hypothetical protein
MAQELISVGTSPNDGTGDSLRLAFTKINNNFSELYSSAELTDVAFSVGNTASQVIFQTPVSTFTQAKFQIHSIEVGNPNMQNVTIDAAIINNNTDVKFSAYGTIFVGSPLTNYKMDVFSGNVRLMVDPLVQGFVKHLISYKVQFIGTSLPGVDLTLDGYAANTVLFTESGVAITTES